MTELEKADTMLDELDKIVDVISVKSIQDFVRSMVSVAPASFRTAKASRAHHPTDERGPCGNLLHTIRVVKLVRLLANSCDLDTVSTSICIAAAVIHDICRYGLDDEGEATLLEHPLLPRELAKRNSITCEHEDDIFQAVEGHMGRWGPEKLIPQIEFFSILHIADTVSAHAEEVWGSLGSVKSSWLGGVPFVDEGMTQELMTVFEELAGSSEYWGTALSFVRSVSSRKIETLTVKQQDWIHNIIATLLRELDKRAAEEAFRE